ncbi:MAG: hypothetical protein ACFFAN_10235 [Promethearchaeota archaeon]
MIHNDNYSLLPEILEGIKEIQENGFNLSIEYLKKLKPLIDSYDENIQEMAIYLYSNSIVKNKNLIKSEIKFIISKLNDFEPLVKETFIDILIEIFFEFSEEYQIDLLEALINSLKDEIWTIRIKIVEFLNKIVLKIPDAIRKFDKELEILYEEKDVDVIREVLDFLLRLFIETYTNNDIKNLIKSIPDRDWIAQEKILFLIGKLGIKKKELIEPIKKDLLFLLDYDDYLVNKFMINIINEIIEYHPAFFDDIIFSLIKNEDLDNLEAIEDILKYSILKHGFKRFYDVFKKVSLLDYQIFDIVNNVIRKIYDIDLKLMKSIFSELLTTILNNLNQFNYLKLRMILFPNPHYDIYSTCYKILKSKGPLQDDNEEYRRDKLIKLLHDIMPELGYMTMNIWLDLQLKQGQVKLKELCDKFHLTKSKLMEILKILLKRKMLKAIINNDIIEPIKDTKDLEDDLLFLKKWKITRSLKTYDYEIQLLVKIKNTSKVLISDLSVTIDYPQNLFIKPQYINNDQYIPPKLKPNQDFILTWKFHKYYKERVYPLTSSMKIIIIYQKEEIVYSKVKKLDILLI